MKDIKLIIFDLDGTFYDINDVIESVYDCQVAFFSRLRRISGEEAREIFAKRGIFPYASSRSKSCTEYFESIGIPKDEWTSYRESHFDVTSIDVSKAVDPSVIRKFANMCASGIYLLSSNTYDTIQRVLKRLGIDAGLFAEIISSDRFVSANKFNKREAMASVLACAGVRPDEALSIGDRYSTDILPMLELGGCGVLVKTPRALNSLCGRLESKCVGCCEDSFFYEGVVR